MKEHILRIAKAAIVFLTIVVYSLLGGVFIYIAITQNGNSAVSWTVGILSMIVAVSKIAAILNVS